MPAITEH